MLESVIGEASFFGAEDHCNWLVEWEGVESVIVLMWASRHDFITFTVKIVESFRSVELVHVIFVKVEPFAAAYHDIWIDVVDPFVLDDVDILNAGQVATS